MSILQERLLYLTDLPDDVLLRIFYFLNKRELLQASLVCASWRRLARDGSLWCSLDLTKYVSELQEETLARILKFYFVPMGKHLSLRGSRITSQIVQLLLTKCRQLQSLSLRECKLQSTLAWFDSDMPYQLKKLDLREACGFSAEIEHLLEQATGLECLGLYYCISSRFSSKLLLNKNQLRILDCSTCDWFTDTCTKIISENCPRLESISLVRCCNIQGYYLKELVQNCSRLKTILLGGTRIVDDAVSRVDWKNSCITELDIINCYRLGADALCAVLPNLPRLQYLRCAITDEVLHQMHSGFPELSLLHLHRRYPITVEAVKNLLLFCPRITCLDISSIPLACVHFETFLPFMPLLKSINFAGNELLGTERIVNALASFCLQLKTVSINYYHSSDDEEIKIAFSTLMRRCRNLTTVILSGLYVTDLVKEIQDFATKNICTRKPLRVYENEHFRLPKPSLNLDNFMRME